MKYVAYYRVSTQKQGKSGLGLDAQRKAVADFMRSGELVGEFQEVESGKNDRRPMLAKAIEMAKDSGATLLIAKLDRLSRKASFIFALKDSGVPFIACDMPEANTLTIGIMAVMAEHEREMTSARTKAAAQIRKERRLEQIRKELVASGVTYYDGQLEKEVARQYRRICQASAKRVIENVLPTARMASVVSKKAAAAGCKEWRRAGELARSLQAQGLTLRAIADKLNQNEYTTRHGKPFAAMTVKRLLA